VVLEVLEIRRTPDDSRTLVVSSRILLVSNSWNIATTLIIHVVAVHLDILGLPPVAPAPTWVRLCGAKIGIEYALAVAKILTRRAPVLDCGFGVEIDIFVVAAGVGEQFAAVIERNVGEDQCVGEGLPDGFLLLRVALRVGEDERGLDADILA
jgi:hypothetical protein